MPAAVVAQKSGHLVFWQKSCNFQIEWRALLLSGLQRPPAKNPARGDLGQERLLSAIDQGSVRRFEIAADLCHAPGESLQVGSKPMQPGIVTRVASE